MVFRADLWEARLEPAAVAGVTGGPSPPGTDITGEIAQRVAAGVLTEADIELPAFARDLQERVLLSLIFESVPVGLLFAGKNSGPWSSPEHLILENWIPALAAVLACQVLQREMQAMGGEREQLRRKLAERKLLERAKGILQARNGVTEEQAYMELRRIARQNRVTLAEAASRIVERRHAPFRAAG
jgi:hypothetical protein